MRYRLAYSKTFLYRDVAVTSDWTSKPKHVRLSRNVDKYYWVCEFVSDCHCLYMV